MVTSFEIRPRTGHLLAASSALLAAIFFIPYKAATVHGAAGSLVVALLLPAALFNTATTLWRERGTVRIRRADVLVAVLIGVFTVVGNFCMTEALARIDPGVTSVFLQTQVFFVAIAAWLFLRERITLAFMLGAFVAVGGFAFMRLSSTTPEAEAVGSLWAFGAALSFAMMHVVTRRFIKSIRPVTVNALRLWLAVAILLAIPGRAAGVIALPAEAWILTVTAAFFGPYAARLCIMFAVRHIAASHAALIGLLSPVFAFLLELLILGTVPTVVQVLGAAAILSGVAIPVYAISRAERAPALAQTSQKNPQG